MKRYKVIKQNKLEWDIYNFLKTKQRYIQRFRKAIFGLLICHYVNKFMLCAAQLLGIQRSNPVSRFGIFDRWIRIVRKSFLLTRKETYSLVSISRFGRLTSLGLFVHETSNGKILVA